MCANLLLESGFDNMLSHNVDDLEAVRCYFANKDRLSDFYSYYADKLETMKLEEGVTIDLIRSFVLTMFKDFKKKLLNESKQQLPNIFGGAGESIVAVNESGVQAQSEFSHGVETRKSPGKDKGVNKEVGSLQDANLSDFEAASVSKGWTSAHYSPINSLHNEVAMTSRKKIKSRFMELAQDAKVKAFHREWPILHGSTPIHVLNSSPLNFNESEHGVGHFGYQRPLLNKRSSDLYQDNSPSMISMVTKDDKKVIKDRVTTYDALMKNAWYLKNYLRNLPIKKHEIQSVIESFYFDDKDLVDALSEHRSHRNNTKTLHKIQQILDNYARQVNQSPKRIYFNCRQTLDFMGFFDIIGKEWVPLLRNLYEKLDARIYNIWDDFARNKRLEEFGKKLTQLGAKAAEERRALSKKVGNGLSSAFSRR